MQVLLVLQSGSNLGSALDEFVQDLPLKTVKCISFMYDVIETL